MRKRGCSSVRQGLIATVSVLLLGTAPPRGVQAQAPAKFQRDTTPPEQVIPRGPHAAEVLRLRAQMEAIRPRLHTLSVRAAQREDSLRQAYTAERAKYRALRDTVAIGPFRLSGTEKELRRLIPYFTKAWNDLRPAFKGAEDQLDSVLFVTAYSTYSDSFPKTYGLLYDAKLTDDRHAKWMAESALGRVLTFRLPHSIRDWLVSGGIGGAGDLQAIQRTIAFSGRHNTILQDEAPSVEHCSEGIMADCRNLLALAGARNPYAQLPLRSSFITYVVRNAKPGAVAASTNDTSPTVEAIEHLGGAPLDQLIRGWLDYVDQQRARGFTDAASMSLSTMFWLVVCAALAMRSTRWRLG